MWVINQKNVNNGTKILKSNLTKETPNHVKKTIPNVFVTNPIAEKPTPCMFPLDLVIYTPIKRWIRLSITGDNTPSKKYIIGEFLLLNALLVLLKIL
jgi:hypothetical protein